MKKKILVRAPILVTAGYGEQARFALRALREYEEYFDIYAVSLPWGQCGWSFEDTEERKWIDSLLLKTQLYLQQGGQFDMSLQISIPNEKEVSKMAPVDVLYTSGIETTKISGEWVSKINEIFDRVLVISNHAKYGFDTTSYEAKNNQTGEIIKDYRVQKPVKVVHYAYPKQEPKDLNLDSLPHDFNFLLMSQWSIRKNFENTVRWFVEEFIDVPVGLVVKTSLRNHSMMDREHTEKKFEYVLKDYKERKCSVHLLHGDLSQEEMAGLYSHKKIKATICISHGEGWSFSLFDSATYGTPVITIDWGGQTDFLYASVTEKDGKTKNKPLFAKVDYDIKPIQKEAVWNNVLIPESQWAYPKQGSFKMKLREMYKGYSRFKSQTKQLQKHIKENFDSKDKYKEFVEALLDHSVVKVSIDDLPKVSILTSVFKGGEFIDSFIENVKEQSVFPNKCEVVFVHPKTSPDFEKENASIEKFKSEYPENIVYKVLDEDKGVYGCWNEAIRLSTSTILSNWNLDDRKSFWSLERHMKALYRAPKEVDLVYSDAYITHKSNEKWVNNSGEEKLYARMEKFSPEAVLRQNLPHCAPVWRKSLHDRFGHFSEEYFSCSDWEFWLRSVFGGAIFQKMESKSGVLYYMNPSGLSSNKETDDLKRKQELEVFRKYQKMYIEKMREKNE